MSREQQSQWEFGDLFEQKKEAPIETRKVYSVTELNRRARNLLESQLGNIWVEGEISAGKLNWEPKKEVAEREGFEPSIGVNLYSLSRGALSTTQPSLRAGRAAWPSAAHRSSRHWPAKRSNCGDGSMLRSVSRSADCRET